MLAVLALLATLASGCASVPGSSPAASLSEAASAPPSVAAAPTSPTLPTASPADDDFARLVRRATGGPTPAGSELDVLWRAVMAEAQIDGMSSYEAPSRVIGTGGLPPDTVCAEGTPPEFWENNAFYCRADASIAFDEAWLRDFEERHGPFAPVAVLAHEWGHHVQAIAGVEGYSIQTELQADCLAGLYLANVDDSVPELEPVAEAADELSAALTTFFEIGNDEYRSSEWFAAAEHGSPQQRIMAFGTGYVSSADPPGLGPPIGRGLSWCFGYVDFEPADFSEVGPYRLLNLPGREEEALPGPHPAGLAISPESRLGYSTSAIDVQWLAGSAADDIALAFPGLVLLSEAIPLDDNLAAATGDAYFFEQGVPADTADVRSGIIAIVEPDSGDGALVVVAYRDEPAPTDDTPGGFPRVAESLIAIYQVLNRLCAPGETGAPGSTDFNPVCMDVQ